MVEGGDVYLTDDGLSRGTGWGLELSRVEYSVEMWMYADDLCKTSLCVHVVDRNGICCRRVYMMWPILRNAFSTPTSMTSWTIKLVSWTTLTIRPGSHTGLSRDLFPWVQEKRWNRCITEHAASYSLDLPNTISRVLCSFNSPSNKGSRREENIGMVINIWTKDLCD